MVEITIFNRGFKTEEAIELHLNPHLRYEVVGSNIPDANITKSKLSITRIGQSDEATVLLLVEGGLFSKSDILSCLSKESKGSIVAKLEDVPPTGPQRITLVGLFVGIPALIYAGFIGLDYAINPNKEEKKEERTLTASPTTEEKEIDFAKEDGWIIPSFYESTSGLFADAKNGKIRMEVGQIKRFQNTVSIPIKVTNKTPSTITFTLSMTSNLSEENIPSYERRTSDSLVAPGTSVEKSVKLFIPKETKNTSDKIAYIELFIKSLNGDSLSSSQSFSVEQ